MKKLIVLGLALAALLATGAAVQAHGWGGWCGGHGYAYVGGGCEVTYVDQVVTCYRTEYVEKDVTYTVRKPVYKEVVNKHKVTVMVLKNFTKEETFTVYKMVPKEIEEEVTFYKLVPKVTKQEVTTYKYDTVAKEVVVNQAVCTQVPVTYNICGCCFTCYQTQVSYVPVKQTVYECVTVPVKSQVDVTTYEQQLEKSKVKKTIYECVGTPEKRQVAYCQYVPEEREFETRHTVCEFTTEEVKGKQRVAVCVPYQTTVKVPVYTPCAPPPCGPWPGH
jgi:hypothetical protein